MRLPTVFQIVFIYGYAKSVKGKKMNHSLLRASVTTSGLPNKLILLKRGEKKLLG